MGRYVLTTPVRDEMEMLPGLLAAIDALEPRPALWLVVDDGSTDGSKEWLEARAAERDFLEVVSAPHASQEYLGGHIARIKRWGLETARARATARGADAEFAGVLDADVDLPPDHYARLMAAFDADASLGVTSSLLAVPTEHGAEIEPFQRLDLPRGPTQFFRVSCLDAIGGLPPWPGFDGAANVKAQLAGYGTRIVDDLRATHRRATATRFGTAPGFARKGQYAWFLGIHPALVVARAVGYTLEPPYTAGAYFLKGWLGDALRRAPRCPDEELLRANGWSRVRTALRASLGIEGRYARRDRG